MKESKPVWKSIYSHVTSPSTWMGYLSAVLMYLAYAFAGDAWLNPGLLGVSLFIGFCLPYYSKISNRVDEWFAFKTALVTPGRIGRFIIQLIFNLSVFFTFLATGVVRSEDAGALGGVWGIAMLTTAASQGIQYLAIALANREIGETNRNVAAGLSINILITAAAAAGLGWTRPAFIVVGIVFGVVVFGIGMASDWRGLFPRKGGIGVFFGTFNPIHNTHLAIVQRAIEERGLEKVIIHSTVIPKLHADALRNGEMILARRERGMRIYETTDKADVHVRYFPTGHRFYEFDTRKKMMEWAIAETGMSDGVDVLSLPEAYEKSGFYGILKEVRRRYPGKRIHGIHGSDLGGMWVRRIYDESGWITPFAIRRVDGVSATAIRDGAKGMASQAVERLLAAFAAEEESVRINGSLYDIQDGMLEEVTPTPEIEQEDHPLTFEETASTREEATQASSLMSNEDSEKLSIRVVETEDDRMKTFLVRGIVYMHGQQCPYREEFDRNDSSATQILGTVGEEPVLTARIRYFGGFVKFERLGIREEYRGKGYGHQLIQFMMEFAEKKGYRRFYLHAQTRLEEFYQQYGFKRVGDTFNFSDHGYIEMVAGGQGFASSTETEEWVGKEPLRLNRPEGSMEEEGPMEESLVRIESLNTKAHEESEKEKELVTR
ncbi:GNAT family N-acetyltransferase [Marininema halotolerans]|uniref:Predicted N-acyltransferase, GNAT family n=1 Tax=Marininema halotolerans TaxID=1155944 RepID=A0A1I6NS96_9BACL|nr:GNAT family N-acetyltransferase [Marininema halotolerans]SFS30709.1 Predicted N-acyltransferase, GNAT family [Marininema halotolerans]